ncbi:MAG: hypothetical protein OJF49_001497 [Ktedonobacterales bacterium]|nr:MAG: hypothetical protein OJF49_001497 [Ktedonobacterales bacterium]
MIATTRPNRQTSVSVSAWKFEAPRLPDALLPRPHLTDRLERCLGRKRASGDVFLLSAPAGYGKTTALAQWAKRTPMPVVWYHLDASDDDLVIFLSGLMEALRARLPQSEWEVERLLTRTHRGALSALDARRATALLIRDIARNVQKPLALALTGISELSENSAAQATLNTLLARPADHLRLVIEAREVPRIRVAQLLTQHRLDGMGADDLCLRDDELEALLDLIGISADANYIESLRALSGGWITGVLLATGGLLPSFLPAGAADFDRERVIEYLAAEVLEQLPAELYGFAREAAVLSAMTAPLCDDLLGMSEAREYLSALERRTGFVTRIGRRPQEPIYRFQPLLRQALLERMDEEPGGPKRRCTLHARAGELLEALGDYEEAVRQYAEAERFDRVLALIEARRSSLLRAGRGATLVRWLDLLPEAVRADHPDLHVLVAELYRQTGRIAEAEAANARACALILPDAKAHPTLAARALYMRAVLASTHNDYAAAREDCEAALRYAPLDADELRVQIGFQIASILGGADPIAALAELSSIEERCARLRDLWALARLHYLRSGLLMTRGVYREAEQAALASLRYAQEGNDEVDAIISRLNLGAIKNLQRQPAAAREHFEIASAQAEAAGYALGRVYALMNLAELELNTGQIERAVEVYAVAQAAADEAGDTHLCTVIAWGMGYALTLLGRADEACQLLTDRMEASDAGMRVEGWTALMTARGFAQQRAGDVASAIMSFEQAIARAEAGGAATKVAIARLHLAAALLTQRDKSGAAVALGAALDGIAGPEGVPQVSFEARQLPELRPLLSKSRHPAAVALLTELAPDAEAATQVLAGRTSGAEVSAMGALRVFALGEARVFAGTNRITRWRMPHARELLYFLLDRGEPMRKEVILETFWPDKDPESTDNTFRQARFRLKQALGQECLVQEGGRWRLTVDCWYDVHEFERLATEGERLATEGQLAAAVTALKQALTYWTGDFLDDLYSDWVVERRDTLRRRYLASLDLLADLEARLGQHEDAAQRYFLILEAEPYRESAHRGLMRYYQRRGELTQAVQQFARCYTVIKQEVGAAPSRETVQLYQTIRSRLDGKGVAVRA